MVEEAVIACVNQTKQHSLCVIFSIYYVPKLTGCVTLRHRGDMTRSLVLVIQT